LQTADKLFSKSSKASTTDAAIQIKIINMVMWRSYMLTCCHQGWFRWYASVIDRCCCWVFNNIRKNQIIEIADNSFYKNRSAVWHASILYIIAYEHLRTRFAAYFP
jgi:hypothetical protein